MFKKIHSLCKILKYKPLNKFPGSENECYQFTKGILESDKWLNGNILGKLFKIE